MTTWPPITEGTNNGKPVLIVDARVSVNGKRVGPRKFFQLVDAPKRARKEAEGWAKVQRSKREVHGSLAFEDRFNVTSEEKRVLLDMLAKMRQSVSVDQAMTELIKSKEGNRSRRYCYDLRLRLSKLAEGFADMTMAQITTADLEDYLADLKTAAGTRNTHRRDIITLWSFSAKTGRGWVDAKIAKDTAKARESNEELKEPPMVLVPEQAEALLRESREGDLIAYHALGLFAGLRVQEINRLEWQDIDFARGHIDLSRRVSKTRKRRLIPILPNLREWLMPIAKQSGKVVPAGLRKRHEGARERAAISIWQEHILRHSFVSYRLADLSEKKVSQVAYEAGHDEVTLFQHYLHLVTAEDGKRFFQICPRWS